MSGTESDRVVVNRGTYPFRHAVSLTDRKEVKIATDYQVRQGDHCWNEKQENYISIDTSYYTSLRNPREIKPHFYQHTNLTAVGIVRFYPTLQKFIACKLWRNEVRSIFEFEPLSKTEMLVILARVGNNWYLIPWKSDGEFDDPQLIMEDVPAYIEASWKPEDFLTKENKQ